MRSVDYLIVGQGIAGSVLAYTLLNHGKTVFIANTNQLPSASRVAAGIYNPVTGRRMVNTWKVDVLFPFLVNFYRRMEQDLHTSFHYSRPIYRPFYSPSEEKALRTQEAKSEFAELVYDSDWANNLLRRPLSGSKTTLSGFVDVVKMLDALGAFFRNRGMLIEQQLLISDLEYGPDSVIWQDIAATKVIFCEGAHAANNPYFQWLPFCPVKGEILTLATDANLPDYIFNSGLYILPMENGLYKVGATYAWDQVDDEPTEQARNELVEKLQKLFQFPYQIVDQQAGIRPATIDRRPFIGLHPQHPALAIFNGLGTKGISLAPYFAQQFYAFLEHGKELDTEVNINRHISLYFSQQETVINR